MMRNNSADCADNAAALPEPDRRIAFNFLSLQAAPQALKS
jgi:hypothetical protein